MKKLYSCGIFIDLQEAFHDLLLCKLKYYGMRGIANCWFCSNRRQTIQVSPYITKNEVTSCGAPQDSVLSPLLFLISQMISPIHLINWISFCLPVTRTCSMLIRISPLWELTVDRELAVVCDWLMANKLSTWRNQILSFSGHTRNEWTSTYNSLTMIKIPSFF